MCCGYAQAVSCRFRSFCPFLRQFRSVFNVLGAFLCSVQPFGGFAARHNMWYWYVVPLFLKWLVCGGLYVRFCVFLLYEFHCMYECTEAGCMQQLVCPPWCFCAVCVPLVCANLLRPLICSMCMQGGMPLCAYVICCMQHTAYSAFHIRIWAY